jgi:hypothetical protein
VLGAIVDALRARLDLQCEQGLSSTEATLAEQQFGVRFPPLWRQVLRVVHPVALPVPPRDSDGVLRWTAVPDWRGRDLESTRALIEAPVDGVLFDVEMNGFWWPEWGARPRRRVDRIAAAREHLGRAPRLVPLWNHLFVSSDDGAPVLSIVQTDLYSPAACLAELLCDGDLHGPAEAGQRIEFWSDLLDWSQGG